MAINSHQESSRGAALRATPRAAPRATPRAAPICAALLWGALSPAVQAQDAQQLRTRSLAASCAHCHGTDGRALAGESMVRLAGLPAEYMIKQLLDFRSGERQGATVMHQLTKGYSTAQLEQIARYFAAQK